MSAKVDVIVHGPSSSRAGYILHMAETTEEELRAVHVDGAPTRPERVLENPQSNAAAGA